MNIGWCPCCGRGLQYEQFLRLVAGWFFDREKRMSAFYRLEQDELELAVCANCGFQEPIDFRTNKVGPELALSLPVALN